MERDNGLIKQLIAADIIKIIKTCKDSGVKRLKLDNLELEFDKKEESTPEAQLYAPIINSNVSIEEEAEEHSSEDEELFKDQLMIDDPLAHEEMVMREEAN